MPSSILFTPFVSVEKLCHPRDNETVRLKFSQKAVPPIAMRVKWRLQVSQNAVLEGAGDRRKSLKVLVNMMRYGNHRRRRHHQSAPRNLSEVAARINTNLSDWGIDEGKNDEHARFAASVREDAAKSFNATFIENWQPIDLSTPLNKDDLTAALELLLTQNLRQVTKDGTCKKKWNTHDTVFENHGAFKPFPPYNKGRMSFAYEELGLDDSELDPFNRFWYSEQDVEGYMREQFSQVPGDEYPSHYVRALALYETVGMKCLACEDGSIQWNGSLRTDFCHLVCPDCTSVYALCCVGSSGKVAKLFDKGFHYRSSYAHFRHIEKSIASRMYFLFATRSTNPKSKRLPVYVAEVKGACPNLNPDSFQQDRVRIKSKVIIKPLLDSQPWLNISIPDIDVLEVSMKVFDRYFETGVETEHAQLHPVQKDDPSSKPNNAKHDSKSHQVCNLQKILGQIQDIKEKQGRVELESWEAKLLEREDKVVSKLKSLQPASASDI